MRVADIPQNILQRHFGLLHPVTRVRVLEDFHELGGVLSLVSEHNEQAVLWGFKKDGSWHWSGETPEALLTWMNESPKKTSTHELIGEALNVSRIQRIESNITDATNLHRVIITNDAKYHMKEYVRQNRGFIEYLVGRLLASKNLFPEFKKGLVWNNNGRPVLLAALFPRLEQLKNLDEISYEFLHQAFTSDLTRLESYYHLITQVLDALPSFHTLVNHESLSRHAFIPRLAHRLEPLLRDSLVMLGITGDLKQRILNEFTDHMSESHLIHADLWWRQVSILNNDQLLFLDLEDVSTGPIMFDYASFYRGIHNQLEYVRVHALSDWGITLRGNTLSLLDDILHHVDRIFSVVVSKVFSKPSLFSWFVFYRAIQEYYYSSRRFGLDHWLTRLTLKVLHDFLSSLEE